MSDLKNILNEEYKKKSTTVDMQSLLEMIEQAVGAFHDVSIESSGYELVEGDTETDPTDETEEGVTVIRRPIIKISELWGKPGTGDREIMEGLMKGIVGATVGDKLKSVRAFLTEDPAAAGGDISKVMSYLIFLDTFASIITDYGASVTGFLFEAFLAALFGGRSIQVDDPASVGATGSLPIEDNQLWMQLMKQIDDPDAEPEWDIVPYSLKVLRQGGDVHGSFKNLVDFFVDSSPKRKSDSLVYLVVIKEAEKDKEGKLGKWTGRLKFYEFQITRENFLQLIGAPKPVPIYDWVRVRASDAKGRAFTVKPEKNVYPKSVTPAHLRGMPRFKLANGEDITEPTRFSGDDELLWYTETGEVVEVASSKLFSREQYAGLRDKFSKEAQVSREVFAALEDVKGYGSGEDKGQQWTITSGRYRDMKNPDGTKAYIGDLNLDPTLLLTKAEEYTATLNNSIVTIFNTLGALSDNINKYFINQNKPAGLEAKTNAEELKDAVNEVIPQEAIEQGDYGGYIERPEPGERGAPVDYSGYTQSRFEENKSNK